MAKNRICLDCEFIKSDLFLGLPMQSQLLYVLLQCEADKEGVISNALAVTRLAGVGQDALQELCANDLLIPVGSVYVVSHWRVHNIPSALKDCAESHYASVIDELMQDESGVYHPPQL